MPENPHASQAFPREATALLDALPRQQLIELSLGLGTTLIESHWQQRAGGRSLTQILRTLFEHLTPEQAVEMSTAIVLNTFRDRALSHLPIQSAEWNAMRLVRCPDAEKLRAICSQTGSAILAFWHLGPTFLFALGLKQVGIPVLLIAEKPPRQTLAKLMAPEVEYFVTGNSQLGCTLALKKAVERLRKGGVVALAIDGNQGERPVAVSFLGRGIGMGRGAGVLARLSGSPVVPGVVSWRGQSWGMDFRVGDPLQLPATREPEVFDPAVIRIAVAWFESFVRARPDQLRLNHLPMITTLPKTAPAAVSGGVHA